MGMNLTKQQKVGLIVLISCIIILVLLVLMFSSISKSDIPEYCKALSKEDKIVCKKAFKQYYVSEDLCLSMVGRNLCQEKFTKEENNKSEETIYSDSDWNTWGVNYTKPTTSDIINKQVISVSYGEYINKTPPIHHIILGGIGYYCCYQDGRICRLINNNGTCVDYLHVGDCYENESVCLNNRTHLPKEEYDKLVRYYDQSEPVYKEEMYWHNES